MPCLCSTNRPTDSESIWLDGGVSHQLKVVCTRKEPKEALCFFFFFLLVFIYRSKPNSSISSFPNLETCGTSSGMP
ncbi:hypothetical protein VTK73DRAFT_1727 [Phialemonium thermophilum]|uniref:Uncharacterized protein n=1 Tax=Phialemonium thermophilum TaxID=223376 RepID=A0ABR3VT50_9PEZI